MVTVCFVLDWYYLYSCREHKYISWYNSWLHSLENDNYGWYNETQVSSAKVSDSIGYLPLASEAMSHGHMAFTKRPHAPSDKTSVILVQA